MWDCHVPKSGSERSVLNYRLDECKAKSRKLFTKPCKGKVGRMNSHQCRQLCNHEAKEGVRRYATMLRWLDYGCKMSLNLPIKSKCVANCKQCVDDLVPKRGGRCLEADRQDVKYCHQEKREFNKVQVPKLKSGAIGSTWGSGKRHGKARSPRRRARPTKGPGKVIAWKTNGERHRRYKPDDTRRRIDPSVDTMPPYRERKAKKRRGSNSRGRR